MRRSGNCVRQAAAVSSQHRLAPAADRDVGAEAQEALGHRLAEAGAAAGDEDALAGHESRIEHHALPMTERSGSVQRCVAQAAVAAFLAFVAAGVSTDGSTTSGTAAASLSTAASA